MTFQSILAKVCGLVLVLASIILLFGAIAFLTGNSLGFILRMMVSVIGIFLGVVIIGTITVGVIYVGIHLITKGWDWQKW